MPNWCYNEWTIEGHPDLIRDIARAIEPAHTCESCGHVRVDTTSNPQFLGFITPEPDDLPSEDTIAWRNANWGCKSEAVNFTVNMPHDECIELTFDTPWCPPDMAFKTLHEKLGLYTCSAFFREDNVQMAGWL